MARKEGKWILMRNFMLRSVGTWYSKLYDCQKVGIVNGKGNVNQTLYASSNITIVVPEGEKGKGEVGAAGG